MPAKGYVTAADVAAYMGVTFTAAQEDLCEVAIGAAEVLIDGAIKHAWLETGPITENLYGPQSVYLRLSKPPIVSLDSLSVESTPGCGVVLDLTADSQYFVQDLRDGIVWSPYTRYAYKVTAVYTPNGDDVPDEVHMATLVTVAAGLRVVPAFLDGADPNVIQRYVIGGELEVEFRKNLMSSSGGVLPLQATSYLEPWLKGYVIV